MGDNAEPLTTQDLIGLAFTCIGFITYTGFGFAHNFLVAQGPPGQMAYAHFEDHNEIVIPHEIGSTPSQLIDFINGSLIRSYLFNNLSIEDSQVIDLEERRESQRLLTNSQSEKINTSLHQLDSLEVKKQSLDILKQTIYLLENQIRESEISLTSNQYQKEQINDFHSEDDIIEMMIKYNQLFQNDPLYSPRIQKIEANEKRNDVFERSEVGSSTSERELRVRNQKYGT